MPCIVPDPLPGLAGGVRREFSPERIGQAGASQAFSQGGPVDTMGGSSFFSFGEVIPHPGFERGRYSARTEADDLPHELDTWAFCHRESPQHRESGSPNSGSRSIDNSLHTGSLDEPVGEKGAFWQRWYYLTEHGTADAVRGGEPRGSA